ncbi:hypothetical protein JOD57_002594 [Geodermatophilus bullaregiensis]|uniref:right-handed parallel beta-helix repeat-containing protein n=1 Tax=Geodermatophilus bullaregiensis TaxID=1564160 RepID=UPI0019595123|nr:right-handed parallel beta-helix repeat-containing protein [Geodermatophilus bullaregiensis]MBM7806757.1 hypothetical protein [Geodermatophilus bullaregiensis]
MRPTSARTDPRRRGPRRGLTVAAATGLALAALPAGVAGAHPGGGGYGAWYGGGETWVVQEGESIQDAVDAARSGDTILIEAGTYREAVCVDGKGLTIRGEGRDETVVEWPPADPPDVADLPCWTEQERVDAEDRTPGDVSDNVSAFFFLDPDSRVRVSHLGTVDHPASGIVAWGADGFSVYGTKGVGHGRYGVLAADSTDVRVVGTEHHGVDRGTDEVPDSGTAGISVGDSEEADADVVGNHVEGYNLGVFAREARGGRISGNTLTGNCVGVLVFDDALTEVPAADRNVEGGDWRVSGNTVSANNRFCLAGVGEVEAALRVSGTGVQVTNGDDIVIRGNTITDNVPSADPFSLDNPAGGLALITLPPFNNPLGIDPGPVEDVTVEDNTITGNVPFDVFLSQPGFGPLLAVGEDIVFRGNTCGTSLPPGTCGS